MSFRLLIEAIAIVIIQYRKQNIRGRRQDIKIDLHLFQQSSRDDKAGYLPCCKCRYKNNLEQTLSYVYLYHSPHQQIASASDWAYQSNCYDSRWAVLLENIDVIQHKLLLLITIVTYRKVSAY